MNCKIFEKLVSKIGNDLKNPQHPIKSDDITKLIDILIPISKDKEYLIPSQLKLQIFDVVIFMLDSKVIGTSNFSPLLQNLVSIDNSLTSDLIASLLRYIQSNSKIGM